MTRQKTRGLYDHKEREKKKGEHWDRSSRRNTRREHKYISSDTNAITSSGSYCALLLECPVTEESKQSDHSISQNSRDAFSDIYAAALKLRAAERDIWRVRVWPAWYYLYLYSKSGRFS